MSQIPVMAGSDHMTTQIEQVEYRRMHSQEALRLDRTFESPHTPLSQPRYRLSMFTTRLSDDTGEFANTAWSSDKGRRWRRIGPAGALDVTKRSNRVLGQSKKTC